MSSVRNIVFDCNETILDLATITPVFQRLFASPGAMVFGSRNSSPTRRL